jgi:hypothetical protein
MRNLAFTAALLFLAAGPAVAADAWVAPPPDRAAWEATATAVPPDDILPVSSDAMPAALVLLSGKPVVPLTPSAAAQYIVPLTPPKDATLMPFLVRAVERSPCSGGFTAERNGSAVWVDFSCLGSGVPAAEHRALVLYLPASADTLFVTASVLH